MYTVHLNWGWSNTSHITALLSGLCIYYSVHSNASELQLFMEKPNFHSSLATLLKSCAKHKYWEHKIIMLSYTLDLGNAILSRWKAMSFSSAPLLLPLTPSHPSGLSLNITYSEPSLTLEYRWSVTPLPAVPAHVHMALHYTALQWPVCPSMSFSGAQPAWGIGLCFLHQLCLYCLAQYQTHNGTQYILVQQINKIKIDSIM